MANKDSDKPVFQTPNPADLKEAAEKDPIQKREGVEEADVVTTQDDYVSEDDTETPGEKVTRTSINR